MSPKSTSIFQRKSLILSEAQESEPREPVAHSGDPRRTAAFLEEEFTVLVINASQDMAKEITLQLTLKIPGCSIMYAPSIELAKWILKRRKIQLVVSSSILPDGSIMALKSALEAMKSPPHLVVVGDMKVRSAEAFEHSGYEFTAVRHLGSSGAVKPQEKSRQIPLLNQRIRSLGADIRNDLNNPLQEIVAMVFIAQKGSESSGATSMALEAIDHAAKNMARVVNDLENKIREVVAS